MSIVWSYGGGTQAARFCGLVLLMGSTDSKDRVHVTIHVPDNVLAELKSRHPGIWPGGLTHD